MNNVVPSKRARIVSVGTAVPDKILTNSDLEKLLDTTDEWIVTRTGIRQRHICSDGHPAPASELGALAARRALERANLVPGDIGCIICATFTPDCFFPSTACLIQEKLGATNAFAFDISAACAGFVYGLATANALIASGQCENILLVGSEVISKTLDWSDRSTCILFGDAAGAVVISKGARDDAGVLSTFLKSDGSLGKILCLPAWGKDCHMRMNGSEVFRNGVRLMSDATMRVIRDAGLTLEQVDLLIPHQANIRIIQAIAESIGLPMNKVITNVERYGNTSSASIPLAFEEAWTAGRIKEGTTVVFTSLGGGITLGSAVVRF